MKKLMLDTSVIIDFLRRKDKKESLFYQVSEEDLYISIISHTEIFAGKSIWENQEARNVLSEVFSGTKIIPLTEAVSEKAGYIRAHNQSNSLIDSIIAATSITSDCKIVTLNKKDFEQIEGIEIYQ